MGVDFRTSIRLRGGGYRAYSTGNKVIPLTGRWNKHWLAYTWSRWCLLYSKSDFTLQIWLTAPRFGVCDPYRLGRVRSYLLRKVSPKGLDEK